jgi:putative tryptophan/tyrosine transport system substrate-binding protein
MRRREFVTLLASAAAAWPSLGRAQTPSKVYRIGLLSTGQRLTAESVFGAAILRAFARQGYVPDRNVAPEIRTGGSHPEQLPELAKVLWRARST